MAPAPEVVLKSWYKLKRKMTFTISFFHINDILDLQRTKK